ncbi:MAG: hypothetical protein KJ062_18210 [Thermoanaerobaculia bacterium]|nr:hypothetical protein [Thermoanaerobaculia bacterium]
MNVSSVALLFGALLLLTGVGGYAAFQTPTALIPVGFGVLLGICGLVARKESLRRHAMHAAAVVALVGFLPSAPGLLGLPDLLAGEAARPAAVVLRSVMAVLCLGFLVVAVRSFIAARKARAA